jgi:hypothetical protein
MEETKEKLEVSNEFIDTYKYLNAGDMTDAIGKLILTGDKYIDLSVLLDSSGNEMPEPANQSEIREYKLRFID